MKEKTRKYRGSGTFGKGKKGNRGGGSRGGRGRAGFHKHKYIHLLKYEPDAYGRHGFKSKRDNKMKTEAINLAKVVEKYGDLEIVDLKHEGYDKLLGKGNVEKPFKIVVAQASQRAREKVEAAGGSIITE